MAVDILDAEEDLMICMRFISQNQRRYQDWSETLIRYVDGERGLVKSTRFFVSIFFAEDHAQIRMNLSEFYSCLPCPYRLTKSTMKTIHCRWLRCTDLGL